MRSGLFRIIIFMTILFILIYLAGLLFITPEHLRKYEITYLDGSTQTVSYGVCYMQAGTVTCKTMVPQEFYYTQALSLRNLP